MLAVGKKVAETTSAESTIVVFKPVGGHDAPHALSGIESLTWPTINFAIFFGICVWAYKKKIAPVLAKRADDFDKFMKQSDLVLQQAESELSAAEAARRNLPVDKQRLVSQAKEDGTNLAATIAEDAKRQVAFMKQSLEKRLVTEQHAAEDDVKLKMIEQASKLSRESLRSDLSVDQDRTFRERCFQQFVDLVKN